jgi:hypothetical protein
MDPVAAETTRAAPSLGELFSELWGNVRGLVADEADLLAAEAHVALQTLLLGVALGVACAVFAVFAAAAIFALLAFELVELGFTLPAALGVVFVACAGCSLVLFLALRGIATKRLFATSRRELRGRT